MITLNKEQIRKLVQSTSLQIKKSRSIVEQSQLMQLRGSLLSVLSTLNTDVQVNAVELKPTKIN